MPTGRQVHIDTPLSNVLIAAFETQGDFVASRLFPAVSVDKQSNKYYTLAKEAWLKQSPSYRAPKARAQRVEFDISSNAYFCDNYALAAEIPLEDLANADTAIRLRESNTQFVARQLLADLEIRVAANVKANVSTTLLCGSQQAWSNVNSADLVTQFGDAHLSIYQNTGLHANTIIMDYQSYLYAKRNTQLFSRFVYRNTGPAQVSDAQMLEAFMVDNIYIGRSQKNNANPSQTASITSIWGPTALLCVVDPTALSMMTATYGLSFRWTAPELGVPMAITTNVEDGAGSRKVEILEGGYFQDEKVVASALGYLINTQSGTAW
jgi:hypothetical protein